MLEPEVERAVQEVAAYRCCTLEKQDDVYPVSRELLLLGDLSSLSLQEEQLARAAPLLSVPGSSHCSSRRPTPSCSPGGAPLLPPPPHHEANWQEAPELPQGGGQAWDGGEDDDKMVAMMTVTMT